MTAELTHFSFASCISKPFLPPVSDSQGFSQCSVQEYPKNHECWLVIGRGEGEWKRVKETSAIHNRAAKCVAAVGRILENLLEAEVNVY